MFNDNQINSLKNELNPKRVKTRNKGNINLSYLEGFDIIETANNIFGFGNWSYTVTKIDQVSQETNTNQNYVVCYKAVVRILVYNNSHTLQVNREDVGFGSGIAKTLADSHESGAKEAITDALKRSLRSFGNQFGNSLYDKTRNHNNNTSIENNTSTSQNSTSTNNYQHSLSNQGFDQFEYQSLYNLGLNIIEQNGYLIVTGDDIFSKKDSIKACGFRWDGSSKQWYKVLEQGVA